MRNYVLHCKIKRNTSVIKHTGVHKDLRFKQSAGLKPYINLNTKLRQDASSKFEENSFKLMNNSDFGKNCEDVRKYMDVKIAMTEKGLENHCKTHSKTVENI